MRWAFWRRKEKKVMREACKYPVTSSEACKYPVTSSEACKYPVTSSCVSTVSTMDYTIPLLMAAMVDNDRSGGYGHHIHEEARNNDAAFATGGGEFGGAGSSYDYGSSESSDSGSGPDGSGGSASDVSCGGSD